MNKPLEIDDILEPDSLANAIAEMHMDWENSRTDKKDIWEEVQRYIFATDTTHTPNSKLPWANKTTIPKICQLRDNLHANYMTALFPKRKWLEWEGSNDDEETKAKTSNIEGYMEWAIDRGQAVNEFSKLVYDYIDYGNAFATVDWYDENSSQPRPNISVGYAGFVLRRISPLDIVFNPTAPSFSESPKIIRSIVSLGDVKEILDRQSKTEEQRLEAEALFKYLLEIREKVEPQNGGTSLGQTSSQVWQVRDDVYSVMGFSSFQDYLCSNYVEVLTFYGDIYDRSNDKFYRNVIIKVVDRHKVIMNIPNPSAFGVAPIFHCGWRKQPDNLWAMGPLENLIGLQYRMDHIENVKADALDLSALPLIKVKGYIEEFEFKPLEKIFVGDDGDISFLQIPHQVMAFASEIQTIQNTMEQMAGAPREAMGFRTPGEKTAYEVQSIENAASRIFQAKIIQFERDLVEPLLNAALEITKRNLTEATIRVFDNDIKAAVFLNLTAEEISGNGRIRPLAARHFAEKANIIQNLSQFFQSSVGSDPMVKNHFSSIRIAQMMEELLDIEQFGLVMENIRLAEQTEAQALANSQQEQLAITTQTPSGFLPGDFDQGAAVGA